MGYFAKLMPHLTAPLQQLESRLPLANRDYLAAGDEVPHPVTDVRKSDPLGWAATNVAG